MSPHDETKSAAAVFRALADTLKPGYDVLDTMDVLVQGCTNYTAAVAAGLLLADVRGVLHVAASTSERAIDVEEGQLGANDGPCLEAYRSGNTVDIPNIAHVKGTWPAFADIAEERGFHAVHAVPLRFGQQSFGAMNLFSAAPGPLGDRDAALAAAMARYAAKSVEQHRKLQQNKAVHSGLQNMLDGRVLIEQAKGVLAQRHGVPMDQAFLILRAAAASAHMSLRDMATKCVTHPVSDNEQAMIS